MLRMDHSMSVPTNIEENGGQHARLQQQLDILAAELGVLPAPVLRYLTSPSPFPTHVFELREGVYALHVREDDLPLSREAMIHEICHVSQLLAGCPRIHTVDEFRSIATAVQSLVLDMNVVVEMKERGYGEEVSRLMGRYLARWERGVEEEFDTLRGEFGVETIVLAILNWTSQGILFFPQYRARAHQLISRLRKRLPEAIGWAADLVLLSVTSETFPALPPQITTLYTEILQILLVEPLIAPVPSLGIALLDAKGDRLCDTR